MLPRVCDEQNTENEAKICLFLFVLLFRDKIRNDGVAFLVLA